MCIRRIFFAAFVALAMLTANFDVANAESNSDNKQSAEMLKSSERRIETMRRKTGGWMYVFKPADKSDLSKRSLEAVTEITDIDQAVFEADRRYIKKQRDNSV